jgi:hypothetical protein
VLEEDGVNPGGDVIDARDEIGRKAGIGDSSVLDLQVLGNGVPMGLNDRSLDLSLGERPIYHPPDVVGADNPVDPYMAGLDID